MKSLFTFTITLVWACSVPAFAEEESAQEEEEAISGQELLEGCAEGAAPGAPNQYCMRYVFGLIQVVDTFQQADPTQKIFCINPNQVSLQEVTESTVNWLKQRPERLEEDAYKLVTEALHTNYACDSLNV
ncbi:MAG: Rap1a/Tai family immunity protein [Gammaproteobacteria bacterium]